MLVPMNVRAERISIKFGGRPCEFPGYVVTVSDVTTNYPIRTRHLV